MKNFQIKLYNSLSNKIEEFSPIEGNLVKMYSCGPTVYNYAHIGNLRAFVFADLMQRVLRTVGGYEMRWVMNITDIDDKTIRDSSLGSEEWKPVEMGEQTTDPKANLRKLTDYYIEAFKNDISMVGIETKDFYCLSRATDYIDAMQDLVRKIVANGYAYIAKGAVYFSVSKWRKDQEYGRLKKIDFDNFREGVRIDADEYERESVSDFVLWKGKKEGEPYWDFDIDGESVPGRPGWHIECSAMEYELLGVPFDIHTGGVDLKFPHHEDEIAQSHAGYGVDPTKFWCHNEFLEVEGTKMSKSEGNFFTLRDLLDRDIDPLDIRFSMLLSHYASRYNFTFDGIKAAHKTRMRIQDFIYSLLEADSGTDSIDVEMYRDRIFSELANDLHTPKAMAEIFEFVNANSEKRPDEVSCEKALALLREVNEVFNVWSFEQREDESQEVPSEVSRLAEERWQAKKDRDFPKADELRKEITRLGYTIKDAKDHYEIIPNE